MADCAKNMGWTNNKIVAKNADNVFLVSFKESLKTPIASNIETNRMVPLINGIEYEKVLATEAKIKWNINGCPKLNSDGTAEGWREIALSSMYNTPFI